MKITNDDIFWIMVIMFFALCLLWLFHEIELIDRTNEIMELIQNLQ